MTNQDNEILNEELQIPEFVTITTILGCNDCPLSDTCRGHDPKTVNSKFDCCKFLKPSSWIKFSIEALLLIVITIWSLISFKGFWYSVLAIVLAFAVLVLLDIISDKIFNSILTKKEIARKQEYDTTVEQIQADNEAIRKRNLGITEELEKFLTDAYSILNGLKECLSSLKEVSETFSEDEERVFKKLHSVIKELDNLNGKLSKDNFESTYISTIYNVHLPKLLEYTHKFLTLWKEDNLTKEQIVNFADLLEVFRIKISNHTQYMQDQTRDDFTYKIIALNESVLPGFDGSEEGGNHE